MRASTHTCIHIRILHAYHSCVLTSRYAAAQTYRGRATRIIVTFATFRKGISRQCGLSALVMVAMRSWERNGERVGHEEGKERGTGRKETNTE